MPNKLSRREFLKSTAAIGTAAALGCAPKEGPLEARKPNIIYIMADDLGYGDLGCYGQQVIMTPRLDAMALEGLKFTQCYTGSTVCAPSRSVLMTGQHTGHTTVRGNFGVGGVKGLGGGDGRVPLAAEDKTVAEVLKQAGYVTGMTGKWGLGEPETTGHPNSQGFDEFLGYLNQRRAHTYYPDYIWHNREKVVLEGNQGDQKKDYVHDRFTEFALDFVKRHKDETFFLYLPYTIPHSRYEIPDYGPYKDKPWTDDEKTHAAMITRMDGDIGRLLDLVKELGLDNDTLIFFCSDNGAAQRWEGRFDSSGPLRGRKRDLYEGGIRTPMIVRWPGKVPANAVSEQVWMFQDVLPTLADVGGAAPPENIDGVSVLDTLLGREQFLGDRMLYWEFFESGFQQAVRWKNWKGIRLESGLPLELYDLSVDIDESDNIAAAHPEIVKKLEQMMKEARTPSKHWPVDGDV
jgi:arylsulfatase A-like enzyme